MRKQFVALCSFTLLHFFSLAQTADVEIKKQGLILKGSCLLESNNWKQYATLSNSSEQYLLLSGKAAVECSVFSNSTVLENGTGQRKISRKITFKNVFLKPGSEWQQQHREEGNFDCIASQEAEIQGKVASGSANVNASAQVFQLQEGDDFVLLLKNDSLRIRARRVMQPHVRYEDFATYITQIEIKNTACKMVDVSFLKVALTYQGIRREFVISVGKVKAKKTKKKKEDFDKTLFNFSPHVTIEILEIG